MPLDPQSRFLLDQLAAQGGPALHEMSPAEARRAFESMRIPMPGEAVASIEDRRVPGPAGEIPVRLYVPDDAATPSPALLYFHGGGWVIGSLETHENLCKALANRSGARVVAVDYRLAPEHCWPA
ncbi:MAG TPA: alpha/beta hydrolase, partial [Myxococcota bacterium]|nr:alpha/beta hydrolase [Myxococcota bacterium]